MKKHSIDKKISWLLIFLAIAPAIIAQLPIKPAQTNEQFTNTFTLTFDRLNDFVTKGLPDPAVISAGNMDFKSVMMAKEILKLDSNSLPVLIAALQTAGFFIIDENRKILRKPLGDGKGQGLAFYDFETVGMLKLENHGITSSLNKIAGLITKNNTLISASEFSQLMLKDLQQQALNPTDSILRFWARLIIELGKSSAQNVDLMTAVSDDIPLNMLQVSLWTRRLTGDFYALNNRIQTHGFNPSSTSNANLFAFASYNQNEPFNSNPFYVSTPTNLPCDLTNDESLVMDASANLVTTTQGWVMEKMGGMIKSASGIAGFSQLKNGLYGANLAFALLKLVAAVTMLQGEITVDKTPLVRTKNSTPGDSCLMTARIWCTVGKVQRLNCLRLAINAETGLDFNLPTDGPVSRTAVEWHFAGDNEIRVNNAGTRNLKDFVYFKSPEGKDRNQQNQVTDSQGISQMYLVGKEKKPEVKSQETVEVRKTADVIVGVTLKSTKNPQQNFIDIGGGALGIGMGGPLGILTIMPEIGFRLPYVPARASIPVIDHEPPNIYEVTMVSTMPTGFPEYDIYNASRYRDTGSFVVSLNGEKTKIIQIINKNTVFDNKGNCSIITLKAGSGLINITGVQSIKVIPAVSPKENPWVEILFMPSPSIFPLLKVTCPIPTDDGKKMITFDNGYVSQVTDRATVYPQSVKFEAKGEEQTILNLGDGSTYSIKITVRQLKDD